MTSHFSKYGHALIANGYLIVPINPGEKSPAISGWQNARLSDADIPRFAGYGVGVICGQGSYPIIAIDIDISHPVINEAIVEWCRKNIGHTVERIGAAPRVLLVYRAAEAGWAKEASIQFYDEEDPVKLSGKPNHQQIEVLGLGQQFVAYHTHPDTGKDYEWTDLFGGIAGYRAADLPVITEAHIDALMAELDRLVRSVPSLQRLGDRTGGQLTVVGAVNNALAGLSPVTGTSLSDAVEMLRYVDNKGDGVDYDTWVRVGMALHHEYSGSAEALNVWMQWGAQSDKNDPREYRHKWNSFAKTGKAPTTLRWLMKIANQAKHDVELNAQREKLDEIKGMISGADDQFALKDAVAKRIQTMMPDDAVFQAEVVSAFRARFRALSGGTLLPVGEVKRLVVPPKPEPVPTVRTRRPLTEFGNAERMLDRYGAGLRFVPEISAWYIWTGVYWRKAADVEIEHWAKETIRALVTEADDHEDRAEFFQFCAISQQAKMVRNMVSLAASDPRVLVPAAALDANPDLLGVQNGVIDLKTGTLLPPDPGYLITKVCGAPYDPSAQCPLWEQTVLDAFKGDSAMASFFQRLIGYAACGQPVEDLLVIPFGNGSNGKSTVLGTIRRAFGKYAKAADAASFVTDGKGGGSAGGAREDILRLMGARFVYASEPDEGGELREGMVKSMTGGDAMPARGLYSKESVEIVPSWVVFMPTNHKPLIKGTDNGIWRRLMLIPFERDYDNEPGVVKDGNREEKLKSELPGVLAWIVRGAMEYKRVGLAQPGSVKAAREAYRSQMDLLAEWLEECCETDVTYMVEMSKLWESWEGFAKRRGMSNYVRSSVALSRRLDSRFGSTRGTGGVRMRLGIRLKDVFRVTT